MATMARPRGVVNPIGDTPVGRAKVLTWPVASVSSSKLRPEEAWNSTRWPSGDQATSCGAVRKFGQRASWYLVPPGLIRYSSSGPDPPPPGRAEVYAARIHPGPTRFHGTLARAVRVVAARAAVVAAAGCAAATPAVRPVASRAVLSTAATSRGMDARRSLMPS